MHRLGLMLFTFERLEVVKATLASDLALELFESVEGHSRRISPGEGAEGRSGKGRGGSGLRALIGFEYLSCLMEIINLLVGV